MIRCTSVFERNMMSDYNKRRPRTFTNVLRTPMSRRFLLSTKIRETFFEIRPKVISEASRRPMFAKSSPLERDQIGRVIGIGRDPGRRISV